MAISHNLFVMAGMHTGMSDLAQSILDELERSLQRLDRQADWLNDMLSELNGVETPPTVPRRHYSIPSDLSDWTNAQLIDDPDPMEEGYESDDDSDLETVVYHTEMWGFYPRGRGLAVDYWDDYDDDEDDSETVVGVWEDPHLTPMKKYAPVAASYFNESPMGVDI